MPLTWRIDDIADYENLCWRDNEHGERVLHYVTECLIWWTIKVGIPIIRDEATARKFYERMETRRSELNEREDVYENSEPRYITEAEVLAHVGLATNADRWTDKRFREAIQVHLDQAERYRRRSERRKAKTE